MKDSVDVGSRAVNIASYVLFGKVMTFAMIGIAFILVTRILGPTQYGIYTLAVAFAGIFSSVGYFGVGTALNKFISEFEEARNKEEVSQLISNALAIVIISGTIFTSAFIILSRTISQYVFHTPSMGYLIEVISGWVIATMLFGTFYDALLGLGNGKNVAIMVATEAFFQASISIVLAVLGFGALAPIYGLVFGNVLGFFVGAWAIFRYNKMSLRMPSAKYIKKILGFSVPVALSNSLGSLFGNIGIIFLGYFVAPDIIGNLGIATRTSSLMSIVFDSISLAILPTFSAALANRKISKDIGKIYGYTVYLAILIVSPLLFYMVIFSTPFSYAIFGSSYAYAPLYIAFVALGLLVGIAGQYAITLLTSAGKVKLVLTYNIIIDIIMLGLLFAFIPLLRGVGYAIVSFLIIPLVTNVFFIARLNGFYKIVLKFGKILRLMAANAVLLVIAAVISAFVGGIPLLIMGFIVFVLLYPLLVALFGGVKSEDINTIRSLSNSIPLVGWSLRVMVDYAALAIR